MKKIILTTTTLFLVTFILSININAQVKTKVFYSNIPSEYKTLMQKTGTTQIIEAPQSFYNLKDSKISDEEAKFAFDVKKNIDFMKEALVENENGILKYYLTLNAKDALNISLQFSNFQLSKSSVLSLYTKNEFTDSISSKENNENNIWATRVYQGNTITIVLKIPIVERENSQLVISAINFGYKNFGTSFDFGNIGASAVCEINANCPIGNAWGNEKNSIAMIVANGIVSCTGALIMNSCGNNTPYLLTANHCLAAGSVPNWVFQFQTLSTDCAANIGWREDIQFNGCTLRANNAASDFALLQLNNTPLANSGLVYSGWSRLTTGNTATTILHHPQGDLMKISVDVDPPAIFDDVLTGVQSWFLNLDNGIVEGGSSGAPYYNQNHQIIGQHFRRPQNTGNPPPPACNMSRTIGGRFDQSWTGGGTNATRLSNWLDQTGTNALTTNTTNISNLFVPNASFSISGNDIFCTTTSNNYFIPNLPVGATVQWQATPSGIVTVNSPNTAQTTLTKNSDGAITLSVSITNPCGSPYVATKAITAGTPNLTGTINPASSTQQLGMFNNITGPATTYVSYSWPSVSNITITTLGSNPYTPVYSYPGGFNFNLTGGLALRIAGTSTCSGSIYTDRYFTRSGGYRMAVSPNPAKDKMTVSITDIESSSKSALQEPVTMTLYNASSTLLIKRWTFDTNQKDYTLNIQGIKMGQYVLVVEKGKNRESQKITIQ